MERHQQAGFSVFVDQVVDDADGVHWESRLYHNESGAETTFEGAAPEDWAGWILQRLESLEPGPPALPQRAVVEIVSVELLDVTVVADGPSGPTGPPTSSTHTVKAQLVVQLSGIGRLEQAIGSRVLGQIARADHGAQRSR